ncbi:hypothetical protein V8F20_005145 [Naviculisporaceae sp. PSN 640]
MLRNDLHIVTGLLELANLGDFAANYWNTTPIPKFYEALMWIGGIVALSMILFVCADARRSWRNIQCLREERKRLEEGRRKQSLCHGPRQESLDCFLQVQVKELRTELDRLVMVALLGFGALLVGIGTFMAPFGARRDLFQASNYLTGWVGNAPCAIYGLFNAYFAGFVCLRAFRHQHITTTYLKQNKPISLAEKDIVLGRLRKRTNRILFHGISNGIIVLGAGAAAMCTATHFWAYCGLLPICFLSFYFNCFWRHKLGYSRPVWGQAVEFDARELLDAIGVAHTLREQVSGELSFRKKLEYILAYAAFEEFCLKVLEDGHLWRDLVSQTGVESVSDDGHLRRDLVSPTGVQSVYSFDPQKWLSLFEDTCPLRSGCVCKKIEALAEQTLCEALRYRERWLLEMLGCHLSNLSSCRDMDDLEKQLRESGHSDPSTPVPPSEISQPTLMEFAIPKTGCGG